MTCFRPPAVMLAAVALVWACSRPAETPVEAPPIFVDRAAETGLDFVHFNGMSGELYFAEHAGPGAALFDADDDGDLDVYLVQGTLLGPNKTMSDVARPLTGPPGDRLFLNQLINGAGNEPRLAFTDVTVTSGLGSHGYGMGVATGDYDNDGRTDLYVTRFGANQLLRNEGPNADGGVTFSDRTAEADAGDERWSSSAAFLDLNADGWLDLFVVNYTDFRIANHKPCADPAGAPDYCGPRSYRPVTDRLLLNRGPGEDGTVRFEDITATSGIGTETAAGLGITVADFDADGHPDIYVANDQMQNHLWINHRSDGEPRLVNVALERGCALDHQGLPQASMGVAAGDVDGDGDEDLFMTHLRQETNTLYLNDGRGFFVERTISSGLGAPSYDFTGFGTALLDLERDGWLDVIAVNGAVRIIEEQKNAGHPFPLEQSNQLFANRQGQFEEISDRAPVLAHRAVSRGTAIGDIDNDGDPDVLVLNNADAAQLLINTSEGGHWLGLRLRGQPINGTSGRDMLGTEVTLERDGAAPLLRRARSASSYLSANDPRVLFGLGAGELPSDPRIKVRWPSGLTESWDDLELDRYTTLVEGTGKRTAESAP